ncbi:MAG: M42 family peptidase [Alphaproteobacteria bacterium]|nr:MAG: M42 family peptidase [Alphaproteobacteria bacterium]
MRERLAALSMELMALPGLAGHEDRVRARIARELEAIGLAHRTDRLGNLVATIPGAADAPSVMLVAHMDQLGFVVRKIEADGFLRLERLGGVPERALAAQAVLLQIGEGRDRPGVIANKSHHATTPEEKYRVVPYQELYVDAGFDSAGAARAAGVKIGTPVVYAPRAMMLGQHRLAGTAIDDRAACAVAVECARALAAGGGPTLHLAFSVQEEFNLRGVLPAIRACAPDIVIQIDLVLATDTPDMSARGEVRLGDGPAISLYSFHGRGTLNGLIPHPALVAHFARTAEGAGVSLQRSAHVGALTETSYIQLEGREGVACIDLGFPMRYSHSALEVCDLRDLEGLTRLLIEGIARIGPGFPLNRDEVRR